MYAELSLDTTREYGNLVMINNLNATAKVVCGVPGGPPDNAVKKFRHDQIIISLSLHSYML